MGSRPRLRNKSLLFQQSPSVISCQIDQRDSLIISILFSGVFSVSDDHTPCPGIYVFPADAAYLALTHTCRNGEFYNSCNWDVGIGEIFKIVHKAVDFMLSGAAVSFVGASD